MGDRGRKSGEALAVISQPLDVVERLRAPHELTDEETEVWAAVVNSEPADWFAPATVPMLVQYCRHVIHARRIDELLDRATSDKEMTIEDYERLLRMQERETRAIAMLATRMRLSQQSTINHRGHKKPSTAARKPLWE